MVIDGELLGHVEKFVRLEQNVAILKDSIAKDEGNEDCQREESVAQPSLCAINQKQRGSNNGQEDVSLDDPEPL